MQIISGNHGYPHVSGDSSGDRLSRMLFSRMIPVHPRRCAGPGFTLYGYRFRRGRYNSALRGDSRPRRGLVRSSTRPRTAACDDPARGSRGRNASRYSYGRVMAHGFTWVETRVSRGRDVHVDDAQATAISCVDNIVPRVTGLGSSGVPCTPPVARYSDTAASHGLQRSSP